MHQDLEKRNTYLKGLSSEQIIADTLKAARKPVITTNFGPHEAAILHMVTRQMPDIPVIWIDSGYGTAATYQFANQLIQMLNLNIDIYHPRYSRAFREAIHGNIPETDTPEHNAFTQEVKLEPFTRAMNNHAPDIWFTAIRKEQTAFRGGLDIVTETQDRLLRVAPLFYWTELDLEEYLVNNDLPIEEDYFDPTKVLGNRECGLHTTR